MVLSYIQRAQQQLRPRAPQWIRRVCYSFVDRCSLRLEIEGFSSLPPEVQQQFQSTLRNMRGLESLQIESA